jgi:Protein of unknown function (DUF3592)
VHAALPGRPADELTATEAGPNPPRSDLLGRQPVRVRAEGTSLAAYGFGHQRIAIPAADIRSVVTHASYSGKFAAHNAAMVVLDRDDRMLLRARGAWGYADLAPVLGALGLPRAKYLTARDMRRRPPRWARAPGFRKLRTSPRGSLAFGLGLLVLFPAVLAAGAVAGAMLGAALPYWLGAVRILIGIAGAAAGAVAGPWLLTRIGRLGLGAIRWTAYSLRVRSPAPAAPFFPRRGPSSAMRKLRTAAMVAAVPALIGWGPGVGIATLVNGFSDQALVTMLRESGVATPGHVIDVQTFSTDSDGNTTVTNTVTLSFTTLGGTMQVPDPDIAGRHWPADPGQTITVVYNPLNPQQAAVRAQIEGSPWHGIPTANLISGGLLTLALPFLTWAVVRRIAAGRRAKSEDFLDGIF